MCTGRELRAERARGTSRREGKAYQNFVGAWGLGQRLPLNVLGATAIAAAVAEAPEMARKRRGALTHKTNFTTQATLQRRFYQTAWRIIPQTESIGI
jgi:hypothetical protein